MMDGGVSSGVVNEDHVCRFVQSRFVIADLSRVDLLSWMAKREYMASWVCVLDFVANWLSISVLTSLVCVVSLVMRRPSKILARVSLRYMPL